jgi:hypothetical protein
VASSATHNPRLGAREKLPLFALAASVLALAVGSAFAAGWVIGRMLL